MLWTTCFSACAYWLWKKKVKSFWDNFLIHSCGNIPCMYAYLCKLINWLPEIIASNTFLQFRIVPWSYHFNEKPYDISKWSWRNFHNIDSFSKRICWLLVLFSDARLQNKSKKNLYFMGYFFDSIRNNKFPIRICNAFLQKNMVN